VAVELAELVVKVVTVLKQKLVQVQLIIPEEAEAALPRLEVKVVKVAAVKAVKMVPEAALKVIQVVPEAVLQFTVITIPVVPEEVVL
jgi:hypothetical protein